MATPASATPATVFFEPLWQSLISGSARSATQSTASVCSGRTTRGGLLANASAGKWYCNTDTNPVVAASWAPRGKGPRWRPGGRRGSPHVNWARRCRRRLRGQGAESTYRRMAPDRGLVVEDERPAQAVRRHHERGGGEHDGCKQERGSPHGWGRGWTGRHAGGSRSPDWNRARGAIPPPDLFSPPGPRPPPLRGGAPRI